MGRHGPKGGSAVLWSDRHEHRGGAVLSNADCRRGTWMFHQSGKALLSGDDATSHEAECTQEGARVFAS